MFHFKGELTAMLHILSGQSLSHLSRKWLKVKLKEKNKRQMKLKYFAVHNGKQLNNQISLTLRCHHKHLSRLFRLHQMPPLHATAF